MTQLSVVVTCTDRKAVAPTFALQAGNLPPECSTSARVLEWRRRLRSHSGPLTPLSLLYKGEAWTQMQKLWRVGAHHHKVDAFVASAGLGLQHPDAPHPSYAATFSAGHPDTVATSSDRGTQKWWHGLQHVDQAISLTDLPGTPTILVLSAAYARAMDDDLQQLGRDREGDVLLVGGWRDISGIRRLRADRALRSALGGTAGSLLIRMAAQWLTVNPTTPVGDPNTSDVWNEWVTVHRKVERYERSPLTDPEVKQFIADALQRQPTLAATRALRELRANGYACEQKRFSALFAQIKDNAA